MGIVLGLTWVLGASCVMAFCFFFIGTLLERFVRDRCRKRCSSAAEKARNKLCK